MWKGEDRIECFLFWFFSMMIRWLIEFNLKKFWKQPKTKQNKVTSFFKTLFVLLESCFDITNQFCFFGCWKYWWWCECFDILLLLMICWWWWCLWWWWLWCLFRFLYSNICCCCCCYSSSFMLLDLSALVWFFLPVCLMCGLFDGVN